MTSRPGGPDVVMCEIDSPVGVLIAAATDGGLCLLEFRDREMLETQVAKVRARVGPTIVGSHKILEQVRSELEEYFDGARREFSIPLIYPGTPFQVKVWTALRALPYGGTISYEELARRIGAPAGQRAAGHANGQNPIAIIIPCHRVINKGGKLGGYGGGLWRKQVLLDLERGGQEELFPANPRRRVTEHA
ncbi:MAG TPA: methylated-DNA--[protein]-cysteine S-methyltransferase [Gemmatimonadaceae bacterium]